MESARALESGRVLVCGAAMLSHVLRPRFNHKVLDVPAGLRDIREQAPEYRSVTVPDRSQRVHPCLKAVALAGSIPYSMETITGPASGLISPVTSGVGMRLCGSDTKVSASDRR